jgi:hypothetical protein
MYHPFSYSEDRHMHVSIPIWRVWSMLFPTYSMHIRRFPHPYSVNKDETDLYNGLADLCLLPGDR